MCTVSFRFEVPGQAEDKESMTTEKTPQNKIQNNLNLKDTSLRNRKEFGKTQNASGPSVDHLLFTEASS